MKLFIDDIRNPPNKEWVVARTSAEAIKLIEKYHSILECISFDHDLGGADTAYAVALLLERMAVDGMIDRHIDWRVHSANPVGRDRITAAMRSMERYININLEKSDDSPQDRPFESPYY